MVAATAKDGCYSNMFHILALASVCGCDVQTIYPNMNAGIRPAMARSCLPREKRSGNDVAFFYN
jgi:hypothetical protein